MDGVEVDVRRFRSERYREHVFVAFRNGLPAVLRRVSDVWLKIHRDPARKLHECLAECLDSDVGALLAEHHRDPLFAEHSRTLSMARW